MNLNNGVSIILSEDERIAIDKRVAKNREGVYLFIKKLPSNSKRKAKRLFVYGVFLLQLGQPLVPCMAALMVPLPPVATHRLSPFEQDRILRDKNYYPQIATILESKLDKIELTNYQLQQVNNLTLQLYNGSITMEEAILQIRGGDGLKDLILFIAVYIFLRWTDSPSGVDGFQQNPLPHQDPFGWLSGKYDVKPVQQRSHKSSIFDQRMVKDMCPESGTADKNGFVMSYEEALELVQETYSGSFQINERWKVSDWQGAKHIYHAPGMGVNPEDYGFTSKELELIRGEPRYEGGGLVAYARRGYRLPPIEMIREYQLKIKESCENAPIKRTNVPYYGKDHCYSATVFATPPEPDSSATIVAFNEATGDLITGDRQRRQMFDRFQDQNFLGSSKWRLDFLNRNQ